jgi:hypothetical protein
VVKRLECVCQRKMRCKNSAERNELRPSANSRSACHCFPVQPRRAKSDKRTRSPHGSRSIPNELASVTPGSELQLSAAAAQKGADVTVADDLTLQETVSVGCATSSGLSNDDIIARAHKALYTAKNLGRCRVASDPMFCKKSAGAESSA